MTRSELASDLAFAAACAAYAPPPPPLPDIDAEPEPRTLPGIPRAERRARARVRTLKAARATNRERRAFRQNELRRAA